VAGVTAHRDDPVVIVGGGIAGLACALRLRRLAAGTHAPSILVLERAGRTGGKVVSEYVDGFVVDGAADVFLGSKPGGRALCRDVGIEAELMETAAATRRTFERHATGLVPASHYAQERLLTPRLGMGRLADAAARALLAHDEVTVRTECEVLGVRREQGAWSLRTRDGELRAAAVVLAVPAPAAAILLAEVAPGASAALAGIGLRTVITVSFGFAADDCPHDLDGYGYLVPGATEGEVSACTWSSSKIPGRAPAGFHLLRGYVNGGDGVAAAHARAAVLAELRQSLGITADPIVARTFAWRDAVARSLDEAVANGRAAALAIGSLPGLALASAAADGAGICDAITAGERAALETWQHVRHASPPRATAIPSLLA
jgi:protoporphyrinogen oxidase